MQKMIPIKYALISSILYFILIFLIGMDDLSRIHRSTHIHLYDPSTSLSTISPFYQSQSQSSSSEPLHSSNPNSYYSSYSPSFSLDDSQKLQSNPNLACNPSNLGYSKTNGEFVFPNYTYPHCSKLADPNYPKLDLDLETNTFSMSCKQGEGYYILEPVSQKGRLFQYDELFALFEVKSYKKPVKLSNEEFVYASCDGKTFTAAQHVSRKNEEVLKNTREKMDKLRIKEKPLIVFMLTVDSFSRRHFYRKMKKTIDFFNKGHKDFAIFDFKLHNVVGQSSVQNIVPIFSDIPLVESTIPREFDVHKNDSMWTLFNSKGFVTMMGLENCDYYFPNALGRYPTIDHKVRSFYCAARGFLDLETEIFSRPVQRCIGPHMSHWYTLNYTHSFSQNYRGLNQWIYIHLNSAHEATGQHAATLDDDLIDTLSKYMNDLGKDHDIAIFLHADHGMRYGNWYQDIEAYQENKLPVFFLIASKNLLNRIPGSYDNLIANTERLTIKKDLRPTINYLADLPYGTQKPGNKGNSVNLFLEKSPLNRTCDSVSISPFDCSCLVVQEIKDYRDDPDFFNLIMKLIDEAIFKINSYTYTPVTGPIRLCSRLTFRTILNVYGLSLNNKVEEVQIKFGVNENLNAVFEVFAFVGTHLRSNVLISSSYRNSIASFVYRGYRSRIKVFGIKRKDKYGGKCEFLSRSLRLRAEFCVCEVRAMEELQHLIEN